MKKNVEYSTNPTGDFNKWLNSDNVVKTGVNEYLEQTTGYNKTFTLEELKAFYLREYGCDE